jgi:phenylpropionate dioxygenase-like ring-hydroxylating dioxygenase large terminal subunit
MIPKVDFLDPIQRAPPERRFRPRRKDAMALDLVKALPAQWYHDPAIFEAERRTIFQQEWLYALHANELAEPGQYATLDLAGFPLILLRDREGAIQAFHNVCRHRGAPLVTTESGRLAGNSLTCRYHGWSYELRGDFKGAPHCEALSACERSDLGLLKVHVQVYRGLVFVNLAGQPVPFDTAMGSFIETIEAAKYPFDQFQLHSKISREGNFNWKAWVDGYQECYHCPTVHPIFNRDFHLQRYKIENSDRYSRHSCERKAGSESGEEQGLWLWLYPNLGLPCYEPAFYTLQVNPLGPQRTRLTYTFHFRHTQTAEEIANFLAFVDKITDEDMKICEQVQKNYAHSVLSHGLLHPTRENGVVFFHDMVRTAVERGKDRPGTPARSL